MVAVNDSTLQVTITDPRTYFLYRLTYPVAFVVDENNVKSGEDWWRKPNGTGPFKLQDWTVGSQLVLARNSSYYGKAASLDSVIFHMLAGIPMNMYETGDIDVAGVSYIYIDKVTDPAGSFHDQLVTTTELSFYYIGFDTSKPPVQRSGYPPGFCHGTGQRQAGIAGLYRYRPESRGDRAAGNKRL